MTTYLIQAENSDGDNLDLFVFAEDELQAVDAWQAYYEVEATFEDPQPEKPGGDYLRLIVCPNSTNQRSGAVHWNDIGQTFVPVEYW